MFGKKPKIDAFTDFNIGNYVVKMFRLIADKYVEIDTIKINVDNKKFIYAKKDFMFNPKNIAFSDKKNNYYAYDFDKGTQLKFNVTELPSKVSIEDVDRYVNSGIIAQIIAGLEKPKSSKYGALMYIILGAVIGGAIGFIIGQQVTGSKIEYLPMPTSSPIPTLFSLIFGVF